MFDACDGGNQVCVGGERDRLHCNPFASRPGSRPGGMSSMPKPLAKLDRIQSPENLGTTG
jgi:hypothetical protein